MCAQGTKLLKALWTKAVDLMFNSSEERKYIYPPKSIPSQIKRTGLAVYRVPLRERPRQQRDEMGSSQLFVGMLAIASRYERKCAPDCIPEPPPREGAVYSLTAARL